MRGMTGVQYERKAIEETLQGVDIKHYFNQGVAFFQLSVFDGFIKGEND